MSVTTLEPSGHAEEMPRENYLSAGHSVKSWLLTLDHKRIAILYLLSINFFFALGGLAAAGIRAELTVPRGQFFGHDAYNKLFSEHGIMMIFFFLIPSIPAVFGNFILPLQLGARDLAFPRLNLLSWYLYISGGILALAAMAMGGVDTGWTFYTPYSSLSHTQVTLTIVGIFLAGFSSIATGINFIVTIHKMRAPGLTWFRMPLFVWGLYATSLIQVLGTPVVAITLLLVVAERAFNIGIFNPALGGDPVLFQHMFWFYSHPAVYIMIIPSQGVMSEVIATFSRKRIFGYPFVAFSSLAIAVFGFLVWGHHMFTSGQGMYTSLIFSLLSFMVAVPSAIKVFNWSATMYKGTVSLQSPMLYAIGFIGLFTIGGLTGLWLAAMALDIHLQDTYFVVAHFHYVMVGGAMMGYFAAMHYWWPKMTGRLYPEVWAKLTAVIIFLGFNLTFFPQFILGILGMPRRYHFYPAEFQFWHIMSSAGASALAIGFIIPAFYFAWSWIKGPVAGPNPWGAVGLEWETESPPPTFNFHQTPEVTWEAYEFRDQDREESEHDREAIPNQPHGIPMGGER